MDWYPLYNSIRAAAIATALVSALGVPAAHFAARLPRAARTAVDTALVLPLLLPPTVLGWLLLLLPGPGGVPGGRTWQSAVFSGAAAAFPLMYLAARRTFARFDERLSDVGRTLGRSNLWVFWHVRMSACRNGLLTGAALAYARAMGEFGATYMLAGYTPGRSATLPAAVYHLWSTNSGGAGRWALASLALSALFALVLCLLGLGEPKGGTDGWN